MKKQYAIIGKWGFRPERKMGLTVCLYHEEDGSLEPCGEYDPEIASGQQYYNPEKQVLYVVDERTSKPGETGGGGQVVAYHFDTESGQLKRINSVPSLMSKPCYVTMDQTKRYVLISCHGDRSFVNTVAFNGKGEPVNSVIFDASGVVVFPVDEDGGLKPACDAYVHHGLARAPGMVVGHPHSIVGSPDGEIFYACDKGLDRIFSYKLDREHGKLLPMASRMMPDATAPRYSVFHPTMPVWYENNETDPRVYAFHYDSATGGLTQINLITLYDEKEVSATQGEKRGNKPMPSDIVVHPNGRYLYAAVRWDGNERIVKVDIDQTTGALTKKQTLLLSCDSVRGMCVSPDGRFLLAACSDTETVNTFSIDESGNLAMTGVSAPVSCAANIQIIGG